VPIRWREDLQQRWPIVMYSDPYTTDEWVQTMRDVFAHPISAPPLRILVDRRYSYSPAREFVERMLQCAEAHRERIAGAKVAVLVSDNASGVVIDMAALLAEVHKLTVTVRTFTTWEDAERWLENSRQPA
jgi:hypothetical protein